MYTPRSKQFIVSFLAVSLLIAFSGSGQGFILCWGHDGHMHLEATFNGVDCGHFAWLPLTAGNREHLTKNAPYSTAPCYCCTDIPLAFPFSSLHQNLRNATAHREKTAISMVTLPSSSFLLIHQSMQGDRLPKVRLKDHYTLGRILSASLRI
jgi:hypothetical protein